MRAVALSQIIDRLRSFPFFSSLHTKQATAQCYRRKAEHMLAHDVLCRGDSLQRHTMCHVSVYVDNVHLYTQVHKYVCMKSQFTRTHSRAVRNSLPPSQYSMRNTTNMPLEFVWQEEHGARESVITRST